MAKINITDIADKLDNTTAQYLARHTIGTGPWQIVGPDPESQAFDIAECYITANAATGAHSDPTSSYNYHALLGYIGEKLGLNIDWVGALKGEIVPKQMGELGQTTLFKVSAPQGEYNDRIAIALRVVPITGHPDDYAMPVSMLGNDYDLAVRIPLSYVTHLLAPKNVDLRKMGTDMPSVYARKT